MLKEEMEDEQGRNLVFSGVRHENVCDDRSPSGNLIEKKHIFSGLHTPT